MRWLILIMLFLTSCIKDSIFQAPTQPVPEICYIKDYNTTARTNTFKQPNLDVTISKASSYVVLLDFNGYLLHSTVWNSIYGDTINCTPSGLSSSEIREVIDSVKKDFVGFNIDLTTNEMIYKKYQSDKRIRVIITDNSFRTGVGGVSFNGSIKWGNETPSFVFSKALSYNIKHISETCSHEIGHTISLSHQVECTNGVVTNPYRIGTIMGNSLNTPNAYWGIGPNATDCSIIVNDTFKIRNFLQ